MATQSLPTMAIMEPPLYSIIDWYGMFYKVQTEIREIYAHHDGQCAMGVMLRVGVVSRVATRTPIQSHRHVGSHTGVYMIIH
jgi:hypothetical protein